ncbi:MAG TPA: high-affinity nickel-transport family protein [Candidatus Limnocylindria bacterium]|nr:high-affinity nickel-transport family protein [Candidatus Limnocylindria bacterium]
MTQLLALAGFGFLLGMRHATDADHVIAVTTILNRSRRFLDTTLIGALWGLGHTITVVIVGVLIIAFNVVIPPPVGLAMEFAVALMLIGLGILNLSGGLRSLTERFTPPAPMHSHDHAHAGAQHAHLHGHGSNERLTGRGVVATFGWYQLIRPVAVGLVHGLAGSAAVALLVLATIQDTGTALAYLVIFCIGVAAGMAILTTVIGLPFMLSSRRSAQINRWLTIGSGLLSLAFGLLLAYEIGIVGGLFTGDFHWEPA